MEYQHPRLTLLFVLKKNNEQSLWKRLENSRDSHNLRTHFHHLSNIAHHINSILNLEVLYMQYSSLATNSISTNNLTNHV